MSVQIFTPYPAPPGDKPIVIGQITGSGNYTAITPGATPSGGLTLNATDLGLVAVEFYSGGSDATGTYALVPIFDSTFAGRGGMSTLRFMVITAATGAELGVVDLTGKIFRFMAWGR